MALAWRSYRQRWRWQRQTWRIETAATWQRLAWKSAEA